MEIIILGVGMFLAGFIDSIVGGGGLVSVPALIMAGLPPHVALGTNKIAASFGTLTSSYEFFKNKKLNKEILKLLIPFAFVGAVLGVIEVQYVSPKILELLIPFVILVVAFYTIFFKKVGMHDKFSGVDADNKTKGIFLTFILGFYDGFFGPGTGTFFMFGLVKIFKFDFTVATANTKVLNFVTGFAALLTFLYNKQVNWEYGLISTVFIVLGSKIGSVMAVKNGSKFIKPIFITMSLFTAIKMIGEHIIS